MTHQPEFEFEDYVTEWFRYEYGAENVERQQHQPGPNWFCDLVVDTGYATLYIEIENDAGSIRDGVAQALGYAAADTAKGVPMVIAPAGHVDRDKVDRLRKSSTVVIREYDEGKGEFVG